MASDERPRRVTPRRTAEESVRVAASWIVERTLGASAPADVFLAGALGRFEERDRGLLRELVYGTLRWLRFLDHVIGSASHRGFERIEEKLRGPLRIGAYQILFLDRVPAYAAVDEAVEQARQATHRGGASFVNAVLRRIARDPDPEAWPVEAEDEITRLGVRWSHPDLLVRRWIERFGRDRTEEVLVADNTPKPLHLLAFRDRGGRELLAERLIDAGLEMAPSSLSPVGLTVRQGDPVGTPAFAEGELYIQDEASQAAALVPPPVGGERVVDVAAAPGGKTFAMLAVEPELDVVMADSDLGRLATVRENLTRLRRTVPIVAADAGEPPWAGSFDRVVVDLPCSGTGILRKHPELKWRLTLSEIERLAENGRRLVRASAELVAPGGLLIVITCSLEDEENFDHAEAMTRSDPGLEPVDLDAELGEPLAVGVRGPGRWQVLPGGEHDGFSVSVLRREHD